MKHHVLLPLVLLTALTAGAHRIDTETDYRLSVDHGNVAQRVTVKKTAKSTATPQRVDGATCKVRLTFPADPEQWTPDGSIEVYNKDFFTRADFNPYDEDFNYLPEKNWAEVELAPGTYDFSWSFTHLNKEWNVQTDFNAVVILEQVNITGDCELTFDPATATQVISFAPLLPDGKPLKPLKCKWDWNEDWSWSEQTIIEQGNIFQWTLSRVMYVPDCDMLFNHKLMMSAEDILESPNGVFHPEGVISYHITPLSDRYQLGFEAIIAGNNDAGDITYALTASQKGSESGMLSNDIANYTDLIDFRTTLTPAGRNTAELFPDYKAENPWIATAYSLSYNEVTDGDVSTGGYNSVSFSNRNEEVFNVRMSTDKDRKLSMLLAPGRLELSKTDDEIETADNVGGWMNCNADVVYVGNMYLQEVVNEGAPEPSVDGFAPLSGAMSDCEDVNFGTSPSILNTVCQISVYGENREVPRVMLNAIGRLGDERESDRGLGTFKVTVDGKTVAENAEEVWRYFDGYTERNSGVVSYSWTDTNFEADGLTGGCDFNMTFDLGKADYCPPTLTALQIRRTSTGAITSVVNDLDDAELRLTAGDFNCVMGEPNYEGIRKAYFDVSAPATVKVEAAPTGTNDFKEIELTEETSMFCPTGIGAYYHGPLAAAGVADGWYDLRVSLADGVGNTMTQTVRLAFKQGERSSIATVAGDPWSMDVENGVLTLAGAGDDALTSVYGVDGQMKLRVHGAEVRLDALAPGIYIVRTEVNNTSRLLKIRL